MLAKAAAHAQSDAAVRDQMERVEQVWVAHQDDLQQMLVMAQTGDSILIEHPGGRAFSAVPELALQGALQKSILSPIWVQAA